jgi:hypothetical protein
MDMSAYRFINRADQIIELDPAPLGQGARALIYRLRGEPSLAARIFRQPPAPPLALNRRQKCTMPRDEVFCKQVWRESRS